MPTIIPRLFITPGEPAGIGPEITAQIAQHDWPAELIIVCDKMLLQDRAHAIEIPLTVVDFVATQPPVNHVAGTLKCIHVPLKSACLPGKLDINNADYVLNTLKTAAKNCLLNTDQQKTANAIVTGPVQKSIINKAGITFTGHTEFFADLYQIKKPIMLFVTNQLRVALATTHLSLAAVPQTITQNLIIELIQILNSELKSKFKILHPIIAVCGLNPHAGEMGHIGREEIDVIQPAIEKLKQLNINVKGPFAADTIFADKSTNKADAIVAMYHDQALPVIKYMSFGHAVNVTLGLPIIRTSVDHGTALDIAGTKNADAGSLKAAIKLAIELA